MANLGSICRQLTKNLKNNQSAAVLREKSGHGCPVPLQVLDWRIVSADGTDEGMRVPVAGGERIAIGLRSVAR